MQSGSLIANSSYGLCSHLCCHMQKNKTKSPLIFSHPNKSTWKETQLEASNQELVRSLFTYFYLSLQTKSQLWAADAQGAGGTERALAPWPCLAFSAAPCIVWADSETIWWKAAC